MPYTANKKVEDLETLTVVDDTDYVLIGDTSDSGRAKKITYANLQNDIEADIDFTPYVPKSLYDANTMLYATTDNTPVALTVAASRFVGRKSTGNISAMTPAEARTELNVADGATANSKATGAELDTGTDDVKFATAKAIKDSNNVPSVAPGTSGNVMTSNGTKWTSVAPTVASNKVSFVTNFEATGRFTSSTSGTGSNTYGVNGLICEAKGAASYAFVKWAFTSSTSYKIFSCNPILSGSCMWNYVKTVNDEVTITFFGLGDVGNQATTSFNTAHAGFMIATTAGGVKTLHTSTASGSAQTLSASIDTPADNDIYEFYINYTSDTSCAFYWKKNGGSWNTATAHTTNLPASSVTTNIVTIGQLNGGALTEANSSWAGARFERQI